MIELVKKDPWLEPYEKVIEKRHNKFLSKEKEITKNHTISLSDFANGHMYFGLNKTSDGWTFREWAPNATEIFLI
ncbi:MAG: 1,4-alpha-glucan-branching enzyme, partial [Dysgonamonadaceae bacterium]